MKVCFYIAKNQNPLRPLRPWREVKKSHTKVRRDGLRRTGAVFSEVEEFHATTATQGSG